MKITKEKFGLFYLILLSLSIYTPKYGVLDRMSVQFFLLSLTNFITLVSFPIFFKIEKTSISNIFKSKLLVTYCGIILISIFSLIKSINLVESFVKLNQLFVFFLCLMILIFFSNEKFIKVKTILWIIFISVIIDISLSLYPFYELLVINNIDYRYKFVTNFVGLAGNRNILALSILFRIPFLIYFAYLLNNKYLKFLVFTVIIFSLFDIYILGSRAALLGVILSVFFPIFLTIIKRKSQLKKQVKHLVTFLILPLVISYILSSNVTADADSAKVESRINSIVNDSDESISSRYRFWSHAIDFIIENPFLGGGIGNWKIYSIKYDSEYIKSYIVPYSAHNDFLEFAAETGVLGGVLLILFFLILFKKILVAINFKKFDFDFMLTFALMTPFLIYFIDLNLNFPSSRPLNIFLLLLFIALIRLIINQKHESI